MLASLLPAIPGALMALCIGKFLMSVLSLPLF